MSVATKPNPAHQTSVLCGGNLRLHVYPEGNCCVVHASGELDLASRNRIFVVATAGNHPTVVIDLGGVTFMDCSGYGSLVACRLVLEAGGRSLTIRGQTGQPAQLLEQIAASERIDPADE